LPCLALPCLALPCLALPCLALPVCSPKSSRPLCRGAARHWCRKPLRRRQQREAMAPPNRCRSHTPPTQRAAAAHPYLTKPSCLLSLRFARHRSTRRMRRRWRSASSPCSFTLRATRAACRLRVGLGALADSNLWGGRVARRLPAARRRATPPACHLRVGAEGQCAEGQAAGRESSVLLGG
jgi:hypothetical protein